LDRANSMLELGFAGLDSKSDMISRINAHYYDRIYLLMGEWYTTNQLDTIYRNYAVDYVIPASPCKAHIIDGFGGLMDGCPVLSPRMQK
jgi:hypothetical protein